MKQQLLFTVRQADIDAYAEATGDSERVHLDQVFAQSLGYPDTLGHGGLLFALAERLARGAGLVPAGLRIRLRAPIFQGDTLMVELTESSETPRQYELGVATTDAEPRVIATGVLRAH